MTKQEVYTYLTDNGYSWDRIDKLHIYVWVSGYKTMEHYNIINLLESCGLYCIEDTWDGLCCKTRSVFKEL